ncbi:hypothetical protein Tco_0655189 [Tanacetum coccineum]|uniref:Uncharacterized protein n=1 Tax=Tanacetum coccineum TaxID=301880 RepID=A0ABQ4X5C2_9ASTR
MNEDKRIMPTKIELTLEQSQQGVSNDVLAVFILINGEPLYGGGGISFQLKLDLLPHAHAQTTKTYYKHQGSRIKKAQELKTKTSANSDIKDNSSETKLRGRLLESFQEDAKKPHFEEDCWPQDNESNMKAWNLSESKLKGRLLALNYIINLGLYLIESDLGSNTCEPTVSPVNDNIIDFRISFDESNNEDYTVIYEKNSFSYKIIYVNDLKTDSENDNDKVNMPSFLSPKTIVSYFNDLDFFKDFENEFPAIVYNDALTSKSNFLTEPTASPQHIDEFNLKDETSLSKCDEEEQNVLYFNDIFPFNAYYPDELKSDTDNDNDKVNIEQPSGDMSVIPLRIVINIDDGAYAHGSNKLLETSHDKFNKIFKAETFIKKLNFNIIT